MKVRKGDKVIVIAGKDKGKSGKVLRAFPKANKVVVEGVNVLKKHRRAKKSSEKGQIIDKTTPVHVSNIALVDPKTDKPTRVGYSMDGEKKVRISRKSGVQF